MSPFHGEGEFGNDEVDTSTWTKWGAPCGTIRFYVDWDKDRYMVCIGGGLSTVGRNTRADSGVVKSTKLRAKSNTASTRTVRGRGGVYSLGARCRNEEPSSNGRDRVNTSAKANGCTQEQFDSYMAHMRHLCEDVTTIVGSWLTCEIEESKEVIAQTLGEKAGLCISSAYHSASVGDNGGFACHTDSTGTHPPSPRPSDSSADLTALMPRPEHWGAGRLRQGWRRTGDGRV